MNNVTPLQSSDSEMASKIKKRFLEKFHAMFDKKAKFNCLSLKTNDDDLFKNRSKNTYLFHKTVFDHAQFRSGQNISPAT